MLIEAQSGWAFEYNGMDVPKVVERDGKYLLALVPSEGDKTPIDLSHPVDNESDLRRVERALYDAIVDNEEAFFVEHYLP